jgi:hypothetical protein
MNDTVTMQHALSVALGIGVAAACGFRVFVPLLIVGLASRLGHVVLSPGAAWLATVPALVVLGTATILEVVAYSVPWLDHVLDVIATPAAVVAGIVASAALITDVPPLLKWSTALIAGGGAAGIVQGATVLTRLKSTALTGGVANPLFSALEFCGAVTTTLFAVIIPMVVLALVIIFCILVFKLAGRFAFGRRAAETPPHGG